MTKRLVAIGKWDKVEKRFKIKTNDFDQLVCKQIEEQILLEKEQKIINKLNGERYENN